MKKGDIVLIPFPFTDLTGKKNRPAVIIAASNEDVTVSFITSQIKWREEFDVLLIPSPENGLKKESLLRLNKMATIEKTLVLGRLGRLSLSEIQILNKNLRELFLLN